MFYGGGFCVGAKLLLLGWGVWGQLIHVFDLKMVPLKSGTVVIYVVFDTVNMVVKNVVEMVVDIVVNHIRGKSSHTQSEFPVV